MVASIDAPATIASVSTSAGGSVRANMKTPPRAFGPRGVQPKLRFALRGGRRRRGGLAGRRAFSGFVDRFTGFFLRPLAQVCRAGGGLFVLSIGGFAGFFVRALAARSQTER